MQRRLYGPQRPLGLIAPPGAAATAGRDARPTNRRRALSDRPTGSPHRHAGVTCAVSSSRTRPTAASPAVPVVDVTALTTEGSCLSDRRKAAAQLHTACLEVGFFHLAGHGVDTSLLDAALANAEQFFALRSEEKDSIWIGNSSSFRGYQRVQENVTNGRGDFHEAVDFYSESEQAARGGIGPSNHGTNQWPAAPATFRPVFEEYIEAMNRLGSQVMGGIALGLDLPEDHFAPFYDDPFWVFRVIHYPDTGRLSSGGAEDVGCGTHTDYGCLTMIHTDGTPGCLQARSTAGTWVTVDPVPGALTCNIGDMLSRWTNGLYKSTPHRVLRPAGASRTSIPFFFEPSYRAEIAPLPSCCAATGTPPRFQPIVYGDHLLAKTSTNFKL